MSCGAYFDYSQALSANSVKPTLVLPANTTFRGTPYVPLNEETQRFMQPRVDDYYAAFTKGVARVRGGPSAGA